MQFGDCHKHCAGLVDWLIDFMVVGLLSYWAY